MKYSTSGISTTIGDTWIMKSIRINQPETIPILLEAGDDIDKIVKNSNGEYESALSLSCKSYIKNKEELVHLIVEKASILDIDESIQASGAVHWICESKSPIICKMVLEKGINNINRFDKYGLSGPSRMTENENNESDVIEIISTLVCNGFNLNGMAKIQAAQPLLANFCQAIRISYNVIEWLLKNGADPYLKFHDNKGNLKSTFDIIQNKKNSKLKEIFAKYTC